MIVTALIASLLVTCFVTASAAAGKMKYYVHPNMAEAGRHQG
jgi:hypothetical protein